MDIRPIRTDEDHAAALAEIERLWGATPDTPEGDKLDVLATLVEAYEDRRWPIEAADPIEVIQFAITDMGRSQAELATLLGSRSRASEILKRKRALTVEMIRKISQAWSISSDVLIRPYRLNSVVTGNIDSPSSSVSDRQVYTADIVSSYVSNNNIASEDLASLITDVYDALRRSASYGAGAEPAPPKPAVPVKESVTADYLVCLEDGKKFKSLKRHLRTDHNLSPEEYRARWGLARDYPMVAPNYAASRYELAKKMGLGHTRRTTEAAVPARPALGRRRRARTVETQA